MMSAHEDVTAAFRGVMATVCTPVAVVTAMDDDRPHGTTVSAFMSLSVDPPMVLVALDRGSELLRLVQKTHRLGVNVLGSDQSEVAKRFARKGTDKFDGADWALSEGLPLLKGAAAWLACEADQLVEGGDHVVALSRVVHARSMSAEPLTYHLRGFGTHAPLEV